ncbi:hypothetical protein AURDEDRAFT_141320 [Auricularia subglabra TFB-10046 SS5]|nr:hypothetical protein AURDEDRAFT_141320 [Auricularia subglabra TFB-10046 SS5]
MPYILPHEFHHEHAGHARIAHDAAPSSSPSPTPSPSPPSVQQHVPFPSVLPPHHAHTDEPASCSRRESRSNSCSLKSSLKPQSRQSSPRRAQSTPIPPKLVHFPSQDCDLQSVRVFKLKGKPAAISRPEQEETETETEGYDSSGSMFARPSFAHAVSMTYALDAGHSSPVPASASDVHAHIHLETLQLPQTRPLTLCGSVLVRNVAYHKTVAARFSLDGWVTTSEVNATYVMSLPAVPPPFHSAYGGADPWDRFSFHINLTDKELRGRTLSLALRYTVDGGQWWDNNGGKDYSVAFAAVDTPAVASPLATHWPGAPDRIPRTSSPLSFNLNLNDETPRGAPPARYPQPRGPPAFLPTRKFQAPWTGWAQPPRGGHFFGGATVSKTLSVI